MIVWLQSNEKYGILGEFDAASRTWKEVDRSVLGNAAPSTIHGFFSCLGCVRIGVYGLEGNLFVIIDDEVTELAADDMIEVNGPTTARVMRVVNRAGMVVASATYSLETIPGWLPNDCTPFVEDEDFDIGLLASNISKNTKRRSIFTAKAESGSTLDT
ncbi:MAG: hypothetical protein JW809_05525 [Pirellulales bacterium]|nr:hypothetical protein [Pirellulales bacterium]